MLIFGLNIIINIFLLSDVLSCLSCQRKHYLNTSISTCGSFTPAVDLSWSYLSLLHIPDTGFPTFLYTSYNLTELFHLDSSQVF